MLELAAGLSLYLIPLQGSRASSTGWEVGREQGCKGKLLCWEEILLLVGQYDNSLGRTAQSVYLRLHSFEAGLQVRKVEGGNREPS